jgi:hypothetical protein
VLTSSDPNAYTSSLIIERYSRRERERERKEREAVSFKKERAGAFCYR